MNLGIERKLLLYGKYPRCYPNFGEGCIYVKEGSQAIQTKTPTSKWPKNSRWAKIADGAPKLDARQIPEWVQSPSGLERA
jgi:hypothetical protein